MDLIVTDHTPENLESTFDASFLYSHPLYSLLAKNTEMKWLVIIPKEEMSAENNLKYVQELYGEIYKLVGFIQNNQLGEHFNLGKIGNKHPNYHIHLVFRDESDEAWPDAIWCHEPLQSSSDTAPEWKEKLAPFFNH